MLDEDKVIANGLAETLTGRDCGSCPVGYCPCCNVYVRVCKSFNSAPVDLFLLFVFYSFGLYIPVYIYIFMRFISCMWESSQLHVPSVLNNYSTCLLDQYRVLELVMITINYCYIYYIQKNNV